MGADGAQAGEVIPCRMLVWTAGVRPHPATSRLGLPLDAHGRIVVDRTHARAGQRPTSGRSATPPPSPIRRRRYRRPCPPTCQHAIRQGRLVARNVAAELGSGRVRPFRYKTKGVFVDMGQQQAVATTMGIKWRGRLAWWLARTYHLAMVPGIKRRARLLVDWNVQLFFGRDSSELGRLGHPRPARRPDLRRRAGGGAGARRRRPGGSPADPPAGRPIIDCR